MSTESSVTTAATGVRPAKHTAITFSTLPYADHQAREQLDLVLALAASDWPLSLFFFGPGVLLLAPRVVDDEIRDFPAALATLEVFGVTEIYVHQPSLEAFAMTSTNLRIPARVLSAPEWRQKTGQAQCLM